MKKIISAIVTLTFILSCSMAQASKSYTLTLSDAIEMAMEDSSELAMCDVNKQKAEKQLKDAALMKKDYKNMDIHVNSNFDMVYVKNGYYVNMFRKYVGLADKEKEKTKSSIAYNTTKEYFTCKNALKLCDIYESAQNRAQENLDVVKKKEALGMCTALEVTNAEISLDEAKANLQKAKNNAELSMDSLKIRLSVETDSVVTLTDDITVPDFNANLISDTEKALETRYDVSGLSISAELAKDYFQTAKSLNEDSVSYFTAYADYIKATYNYSNGVKNITLAIKSSYYDVLNAQQSSAIAKRRLEHKRSEYEVNKMRYEMGLITNSVLTALSDELTMVELEYENALLTHKLAVEKYAYEITSGL